MCYAGGFKTNVSLKLMREHLDWLRNPRFHTLNADSVEYLVRKLSLNR